MKSIQLALYFILFILFFYILFNLNSSINAMSITLITFFKSLFPYLMLFLIFNQMLIKTNIILILGYILQSIFYPIFKINAKTCSLLLISFLNGFPSSVLYSSIMIDEKKINHNASTNIALYFFLPSLTFIFFIVKQYLAVEYFLILIFSLYLPPFIFLLLNRNNSNDSYLCIRHLKKEIYISFTNFNLVNDLKKIFNTTFSSIINILGMICFYSIITLVIPNNFISGLFEFSMPSLAILKSNNSQLIKTLLILILLSFSSFSNLSQAAVYLDNVKIPFSTFIKKRIEVLALSLIIFNLFLYSFYLLVH